MKTIKELMVGMVGLLVLSFVSCNQESQDLGKTIEGRYTGKFNSGLSLKSGLANQVDSDGIAVVTMVDTDLIRMHCFGSQFDSTLMLNLYEDDDSIMVCLTDSDFVHTYGHLMGQGQGMMGNGNGMMGGGNRMTDTTTAWGKHLYYHHGDGDLHFGGFNMMGHTVDIAYKMMDGDSVYYLHFHGVRD